MKLSKHEKETIINFNDGEDYATLYTCNIAWKAKLAKLSQKDTCVQMIHQDEFSQTYKLPKKYVKVILPRVLSEEKRKEYADRAKHNFKNK